MFIALALAQAAVAVLCLVRQDRWARVSLIVVNAGALGGWLVTRLIWISWIEGLEVAEPPHLADAAAAILAMMAVTAGLLVRRPGLPKFELTTVACVTTVLVASGLADAATHDHGPNDTEGALRGIDAQRDARAIVRTDGELPASEVEAIIELGLTGAGPPPEHDHGALYTAIEVDEAESNDLEAELAFARSVIGDLDTIEKAAALGYVMATAPSPGIGTHWVRWSQILEPFDLRRPAMLLFDHDRSPATLVGYSYTVQSEAIPVGFTGESDVWHRHTGMCVNLDGWVIRERAAGPDDCDGSFIAGGDFWMLHTWLVPGWENSDGVFAPMNPKLCPRHAGTPDYLRCPVDAPG